jgi:putative endopeptidase
MPRVTLWANALALIAFATSGVQGALPSEVTALMDENVDPCDDFYQYACGTWLRETPLPGDDDELGYVGDTIADRNEIVLQEIYESGEPILGELWDSCMNVDAINALGNTPMRRSLDKVQCISSKQELFEVAGEIAQTGPYYISGIYVGPDTKNVTTNRLFVTPGYLSLPYSWYFTDPDTFDFIEEDLRAYTSTIMRLSGFVPTGVNTSDEALVDAIISIERRLANISEVSSAGDDPDASYNVMIYRDAAEKYPVTFGRFASGLGILESSKLTEDSTIIFSSLEYYDIVEQLVGELDLDDLKTYLAFIFSSNGAQYLGDAFYQAYFDLFLHTFQGQQDVSPRSSICSDIMIGFLPDLVGNYFVQRAFDSEREANTKSMVSLIEKAMGTHMENLTWLDDTTRNAAVAKLSKVANLIGNSEQNVSYSFRLNASTYFDNLVTISGESFFKMLQKIDEPVDRSEWSMSAATVNAYYSRQTNQMVFPAGILQPPLYNASSHPAQNFGGIGVIIGHELTHSFDSAGRLYDGDGNIRNWWTEQTTDAFNQRAKCFVNEYSTFAVDGEDGSPLGNVDGNLTIAENIADNGGYSLAFDAYRSYMTNASLAGMHANISDDEADQLFFLSHAQVYCSKTRDALRRQQLATDVHSPPKWRVNGPAMNSDSFSRVFQCAAGAKMNPADKCVLWSPLASFRDLITVPLAQ